MSKIVFEHYPVALLPDHLRARLGDADEVTLTIEAAEKRLEAPTEKQEVVGWFTRNRDVHRDNYETDEEIVDWVRTLRDEWSHRER